LFRLVNSLAKALATALGAGYSRFAPGTCGTLVTIPARLGARAPGGVAVPADHGRDHGPRDLGRAPADLAWGSHDSGRIVID